jgi:transcriptional regulator with XRE-family HTH domain
MNKKTIPEEHQKRLKELGCYLRELRFAEALTQQDVAEKIRLHRNTISNLEASKDFRISTLFEICDYYDIPLTEVFQDIK